MRWSKFGYESPCARASDEADEEGHLHKKSANMKCQRVKVDESFVPALEDKLEVQHLLEPKTNHAPLDSDPCFGKENLRKHSGIDSFSYRLERGPGGLYANAQGDGDFGFGVFEGLLDDVEELDGIHAANDISGACGDFILENELEFTPCSDSESLGFSASSNCALGLSESSTAIESGFLEKTSKRELDDSSGIKWWDSVESDVIDDEEKPLFRGGTLFGKKSKEGLQATNVSVGRWKRSSRSAKRSIDGFSKMKTNHLIEVQTNFTAVSSDKRPKIRPQNAGECIDESMNETDTCLSLENVEKLSDLKRIIERKRMLSASSKDKQSNIRSQGKRRQSETVKLIKEEEYYPGNSNQTLRRGLPRKCVPHSLAESDADYTASESEPEDDRKQRQKSMKSTDRRKHQRMWTSAEVMKLVDGITEYGTGRWTDIKKVMFPSSAHRTPVDLRDKWRNLLKASCRVEPKSNKEDEKTQKHQVRPLPESVLCRVQELASIHPYPKFNPGGRYVRRKNK